MKFLNNVYMIPYKKLIQTREYWNEIIENYLYNKDIGHLNNNDIIKGFTEKIMQNINVVLDNVSESSPPKNLIIKKGVHIIRVDNYNDFRNIPTSRITCIDEDTSGIDLDGDIIEEYTEGCFYLNIENIDLIIEKLKEAKLFLNSR